MSANDSEVSMDYESNLRELQGNENTKEYQKLRMMYIVTYCVVLILGLSLNLTYIVSGCWKYKSPKPRDALWIVALAVTHLVSCASIVFQLLYAYHHFEWIYGTVSCKLSSYITYASMFSTATMLSLWSISSTFSNSACTERVHGRFRRNSNMTLFLILFSWTFAAILACPSLFSREVRIVQCIDDYDFDKTRTTPEGNKRLQAVVVMRFLFGLVIPAFVIFISCCVASKQTHNSCKWCKKQANIKCALKIAYFVCWSPQIILALFQATRGSSLGTDIYTHGLPVATVLATTHSFVNPLIYLLLGRSIKMRWMFPHGPDHRVNQDDPEDIMTLKQCRA